MVPSEPPQDDDDTTAAAPRCDVPPDGRTVGLIQCDPRSEPGYTLFAPVLSDTTWLIDETGQIVHSWTFPGGPGLSVYLLPSGNLLHTSAHGLDESLPAPGNQGGHVEEVTWDGEKVRGFTYAGPGYEGHHDVEPLPDGNVLLVAWERRSAQEAIAQGRDPGPESISEHGMWFDHIVEVDPAGEIVWTWRLFDHLVQDLDPGLPHYGDPAAFPGRLDVNAPGSPGYAGPGVDWNHMNAVSYDAERDEIVLTVLTQGEVWIIDHGTTTAEAASSEGGPRGHGGDFLYRWGNPRVWGHGETPRVLNGQHDGHIIPPGLPGAGNLLVFNDEAVFDTASAAIEIELPRDDDGAYVLDEDAVYGPEAPSWSFLGDDAAPLYAAFMGGAQRLPGGNTLICEGGPGRVIEVTPDGDMVWEYVNPDVDGVRLRQGDDVGRTGAFDPRAAIYRAVRIPRDHPGLEGRDLSPQGSIERP